MQLLYVQRVIVCSVNDIQNDGTASVNPAFTEAWDRGACKPPSVAIRSLHNVINRYLAVTRPMEVDSLSGGNIDIITFLARHSEREIFPQDVERRFGITRSTSSRVLALMERKGLIGIVGPVVIALQPIHTLEGHIRRKALNLAVIAVRSWAFACDRRLHGQIQAGQLEPVQPKAAHIGV